MANLSASAKLAVKGPSAGDVSIFLLAGGSRLIRKGHKFFVTDTLFLEVSITYISRHTPNDSKAHNIFNALSSK